MASSTQKPILIAGGGLASLLLAQRLLRSNIPFLVFERDSSLKYRAQGYRLRLSAEGLDAIEDALGPEKFEKFWAACGKTGGQKGLAVIDAITGEEISDDPEQFKPKEKEAKDDEIPENFGKEKLTSRNNKTIGISRGQMRSLFSEGCEPYIHWAHHVQGYELTEKGVKVVFADGSKSVEGDMLIGGEGIYSTVAKQVSKGKLKTYDTGARGIHGQAPTTAFKGLGEGVWRLIDNTNPIGRKFVITNVRPENIDDEDVQYGWTMGAQPGVISPPNNDFSITGKVASDLAKSLTSNWHERVKPMFDEMVESEAAFWKITCSTPSGVPEWPNEPRVTVIGDAVHSMTPAGGIGANTAVRDSALLGRLVADEGGYEESITAKYEKEMRVYASEAVATSYGFATSTFGFTIDENSPVVGG